MFVVGGGYHTTTLDDDGNVWVFGSDGQGELGLGKDSNSDYYDGPSFIVSKPVKNPHLSKIVAIACGWRFTLCVDESGDVWCFGCNDTCQLGVNGRNIHLPITIPTFTENNIIITSVSCGERHSLFIDSQGNPWGVGENGSGELGLGHANKQTTPAQITTLKQIIEVSCWSSSMFLDDSGTAFFCGGKASALTKKNVLNEKGVQTTPTRISGLDNISSIAVGLNQYLFLNTMGEVFVFTSHNYKVKNNQFAKLPPIKLMACGSRHCLFVDYEGYLWACGENEDGQIGMGGDIDNCKSPTKVPGMENITTISGNGYHTIVKDNSGTIYSFGWNSNGQLGLGHTHVVKHPTPLEDTYSNIIKVQHVRAKSARK